MAIEKPYDDPTLDILEQYVKSKDKMAAVKRRLPVAVSSNKSARDILSKMGTVQTNRAILEILGAAEEAEKTRPGLVQAFLDPDKGALFAPSRFGSAFIADVFGIGESKKGARELRKYSPIESAVRSARGEFAVTGGDILPTSDNDNILERSGKMLGALSWDILTDPTSYFGGAGALSRKGIVETLGTQKSMRKLLDDIAVKAPSNGLDSQYVDDVVEKLAVQNRRFVEGELAAVPILDRDGVPTGTARFIETATNRELARTELMDLAAYEMSVGVSEGLVGRGTTGVYDYFVDALSRVKPGTNVVDPKTVEFADTVFRTVLPRELVGGLYLINPITGKRYTRLAGGTGRSTAAKEFVNKARLATARGTRSAQREFGGEAGPIWAQALEDMHPMQRAQKGATHTTFGDYLEYKQAMRQRLVIAEQLSAPATNAIKTIWRGRNEFEKQLAKEDAAAILKVYDDNVVESAWRAGTYTDEQVAEIIERNLDGMTAAERAKHLADRHGIMIAGVLKDLGAQLRARGIEIDLQENFIPLFFSRDALKYLRKYEPVQGRDLRDFYSGELSREAFESPQSLDQIARALNLNPDEAKRIFESPAKVNERARQLFGVDGVFETDPVSILSRYTNWAANRMATQETVNRLRRFGVLLKIDEQVVRTVNANNAQAFVEAAGKISPKVRARLQEMADEDERQLRVLASEDSVTAENVRRKSVLKRAQRELVEVQDAEVEARIELSQALKTIKQNDLLDPKKVAQIRRELVSGTIADERKVGMLSRQLANFGSAIRRYETRAAQVQRSIAAYKGQRTRLQKQLAASKGVDTEEKLAVVQQQIDDLQNKVDNLNSEIGLNADEMSYISSLKESYNTAIAGNLDVNTRYVINVRFQPLLEALDTVTKKRQQLVDLAQQRKAARENLRIAQIDSKSLRLKEINKRVEVYLLASENLHNFQQSIKGIAKEDLTPQQARLLKKLRSEKSVALKKLKTATGWVANNKKIRMTEGRKFAREIVSLTKNLSANNVRLLTVFTDPDKLDDLSRKLLSDTLSHDDRMDAYGELFNAYTNLRKLVTEKDMEDFTELQRRLFNPAPGTKETVVEQVAGKFTAKYSKLQDDLAAAEKRGDALAISKLRAEIKRVEDFADQDKFSIVGGGKNIRVPRAYEDVYGSLGIRKVLERIHQVREDPSEWEKIIRGVYDPLLFVWKTQATVGRGPAYVINNFISAAVNNYIGGVTIADTWQSARMMRAFDDATETAKKIRAAKPDMSEQEYADLVAETLDSEFNQLNKRYASVMPEIVESDGVRRRVTMQEVFTDFYNSPAWWSTESAFTLEEFYSTGLATEASKIATGDEIRGINFKWERLDDKELTAAKKRFRRTVDMLLTNPVQRKFNDWSQGSEVLVRLAAFIRGYKKFHNADSALNFSYLLHFDYRDLGQAEQWVKRLAPFYTWNRYNIPFQLRTLFFQPDKMKNLVRVNENFETYFGADEDNSWIEEVMPEWFDVQGSWISRFGFKGRPIALSSRLPIYDLDKSLQVVQVHGVPVMVLPRGEALAQSLGPGITPLEWIGNVNFDTGQPYKNDREKLVRILTGLVPLANTIKRGVNASTLPLEAAGIKVDLPLLDENRNASDAINLLLGAPFSASTVSERGLMSGLIQTSQVQAAQIAELAAKANVDVEWLRKMINRGLTVRQIKVLIDNGYGDAEKWARQRAVRAELREPNRDYSQLLEGFIQGNPQMTGIPQQGL